MKLTAFCLTTVVVFIVYACVSAPGIGLVDSGELTTTAWCLGIAHPTGYPLYTLLGHLWQAVLPLRVDRSMVLFSAAAGAIACGILMLLAQSLVGNMARMSQKLSCTLAIILILGFAFSPSAMGAVSFAEVYPLTLLIASLLLWLAAKIEAGSPLQSRWVILTSYLWGLGLGNHLTILWFFPVVLFAVLRTKLTLREIMRCAACIALGASVNLYLPLRSSIDPLLNWSHPDNIERLVRHLSAWQYQVWMFKEGWSAFAGKLIAYLGSIPGDIGWGFVILAAIGVIAAWKRKSWLAASCIAAWAIGTAYNMNYSIPDISTYFLTFYAPLFVLAAMGFAFIAEVLWKKFAENRAQTAAVIALTLTIPVASMAALPADTVQRSNRFARDFASELLRTLPDSALVVQADWDIQSPSLYLQNVEHVRRDIVMLDLNLLQRSWYVQQQVRQHPDVFAGCNSEIKNFLTDVAPFEAGQRFDGKKLEAAFVAMNNSVFEHQLRLRPVYLRDAATIGHPGVGGRYPQKAGAYFMRLAAAADGDPVLDGRAIVRGRRDFGEREQRLMKFAALSGAEQGRQGLAAHDSVRVQQAITSVRALAPDAAEVQVFIKDAEAFLKGTEAARP